MKIIFWLKYLICFIIILFLVILRAHFVKLAEAYLRSNFCANNFYVIAVCLISIFVGFVIGLEHLTNEIKGIGGWRLNFPKALFIGLPSFLFFLNYLYLYSNSMMLLKIKAITCSLFYNTNFILIFQLLLGYVIATSFYKHKANNNLSTGNDKMPTANENE